MLWLPVFLLLPIAGMNMRSRMEDPCTNRYLCYEDYTQLFDSISGHAQNCHDFGCCQIITCEDCNMFHRYLEYK